jgi:hypothetical protein
MLNSQTSHSLIRTQHKRKPLPLAHTPNTRTAKRPRRTRRLRRPHTPLPPSLADRDGRSFRDWREREFRRPRRADRACGIAFAELNCPGDAAADREDRDVGVVCVERDVGVVADCSGYGGRVDGFVFPRARLPVARVRVGGGCEDCGSQNEEGCWEVHFVCWDLMVR